MMEIELQRSTTHKIEISESDHRKQKIRDIKERIASGEYKVDTGKIVEGMFKEALRDCVSSGKN